MESDIDYLLQHALPATFGRDGKDVYDESYRKELQLDASAFCSTFNPYELGIVDQIAQLLLPSTVNSPTHRAVRAELYKLNVGGWLLLDPSRRLLTFGRIGLLFRKVQAAH